ncbi:hypothetical protein [Streptomyces flavofungini]|uniref:MarR family transcriptional regulator n=1 Tax=Streptomyces flavofungini TaxID=68200 RepID=A0ABS0X5Q3_9ACTN|nr:hypothetical protein [Streptomyces flavofungini]MBJ3808431.1 hypothetical protein [Streptomyces flavofungini]
MPNEILRHPRLSSDAVRLLTWQLSLPDGADEPLSATARNAGIGKTGFLRAKRQLKDEGYVHEWREQRERGRWTTRQLVSNVPLSAEEAGALRNVTPVPTGPRPATGSPTHPAVGCHPEATPPVNTPQPPPSPDEARHLVEGLRDLDPRLRVPRGMVPQLTELAGQWLALGHSPGDVLDEIRRGLPPVIHKPGGLVRHLLSDPVPPRPPRPEQPQVAALRECAGPHPHPLLFRPVSDEDHCGPCRRDRAEATANAPWPRPATLATALGAPAVRAALRGAREA